MSLRGSVAPWAGNLNVRGRSVLVKRDGAGPILQFSKVILKTVEVEDVV